MLQVEYSLNIEDNYYQTISTRKMTKYNNITFEQYYNSYIKNKLNDYALKDILCGDFEKLKEIKNSIGTKYKNKSNNIMKQFFNYDKKSSSFNAKTAYFQPKISKFFEENIEVHTCYYCNIDFINKFKKSNETKNAFTLDHVLEKADYPYLALSLYNLVPSCYVCNSKVKDSKIPFDDFSPTNKNFDFNERVKFKSFITNVDLQIQNESDLLIKLIESYSSRYYKYIESLNLNDRYDYHKYKVLEMIKKREIYPDSRIKELSFLTQRTEEDIKQDLFGVYLNDKDLHKRPLSKLIKDISEELRLV
ncbi:MAG: HNH endonuclease [Arcobacteraceae bacterium]|jgi:5-methylcytosine-specific restriction endonuclease McrA|nr:HNH endonuclease [Arcobacteraceae bacterium]